MKKLINPIKIFATALATTAIIATSAIAADYKILTGATYSWPKLKAANRDIHLIEGELKALAPGVKKFEDWDDVYTGVAGIGVQRKFQKDIWAGLYISAAKGPVKTSQKGLDTVLGVPMDYKFKQEYNLYGLEASLSKEILKKNKFITLLGGAVSYNYFKSDSKLETNIPAIMTQRTVNADFKDNELGVALFGSIEYDITPKWGIIFSGRYDWLKFKAKTDINDTTTTPLKQTQIKYKQNSEVDLTGPSLGLYLKYNF